MNSLRFLLLLASMAARAAAACETEGDDCARIGAWNFEVGLGLGVRTNPVKHSRDIPLVLVPHISYYSKRFFIDNLEIGYTVVESDRNTLSIIATPGYDRVFFYRSDLQNIFVGGVTGAGPPASTVPGVTPIPPPAPQPVQVTPRSRHVTYLAGAEWTFDLGRVEGQLNVLHEVTGEHHGQEVRLAIAVPLHEGTWSAAATAGGTWKSDELVNYYYGDPKLYNASSAFNPFVKLRFARPLSESLTMVAFAHWEHLHNGIARSPVMEAHSVTTIFAGVVYAF